MMTVERILAAQGGFRMANHWLHFAKPMYRHIAYMTLLEFGYSILVPDPEDGIVLARGVENPAVMTEVAQQFKGTYLGLDHELIGPVMELEVGR